MAGANVDATMMLCDSAQSVGGKLYVLGGGWDQLLTRTPVAMGLAVRMEIADELAGKPLPILARMVTIAGEPVREEGSAISFEGEMELARHPGADPEAPLSTVFALNTVFTG